MTIEIFNFFMIFTTMFFLSCIEEFFIKDKIFDIRNTRGKKTDNDRLFYEYDYITALSIHAFIWTFMVHLPALYLTLTSDVSTFIIVCHMISFAINIVLHGLICDNAIVKKISFTTEQLYYVIEILLTMCMTSCTYILSTG